MGKKIKEKKDTKMMEADEVLDELNALFEEDFEPVIIKRERALAVVYDEDILNKFITAIEKKLDNETLLTKIEDGTYGGVPFTTDTLLKAFKPVSATDEDWFKKTIAVKDEVTGEKTGTRIIDRDSVPSSLKEYLAENNVIIDRIKGGKVPSYWVNLIADEDEENLEKLELDETEPEVEPTGVEELEGLVE